MNQVRLIGGIWKRRLITVADGKGLRPTPDRVRETLFNWLGQDLGGLSCLDLFSGSGALGFEAASRGAKIVFMNDASAAVCNTLKANLGKLNPDKQAFNPLLPMQAIEPKPPTTAPAPPFSAQPTAAIRISQMDALGLLERLKTQGERFDVVFLDPPYRQQWIELLLAWPHWSALLNPDALIYLEAEHFYPDCPAFTLLRQQKAGEVHFHLLQFIG